MRRTFLLFMFVAAATGAASAQPDPGTTAYQGPITTVRPCGNGDLSVRLVTADAAMGGVNLAEYAFKNKSSSSCTLIGYPRFELLDKSGRVRPRGRATNSRQLPGEETKYTPKLVMVLPGGEAGFSVYYNSGGAGYTGRPCPVANKVGITAPGATQRLILREQIRSCRALQVFAIKSEVSQ